MGSHVAVQAYTCSAVVEGILAAGLKPLWIDIDPQTLSMDGNDLQRKVTPETVAVIVQYTFGFVPPISDIADVARSFGAALFEDRCHLPPFIGAYRLQPFETAGSFYSFEWGKPLAVGLGGLAISELESTEHRLHERAEAMVQPPINEEAKIALTRLGQPLMSYPFSYEFARRAYSLARRLGISPQTYSQDLGTVSNEATWQISKLGRRGIPNALKRWERNAKLQEQSMRTYGQELAEWGVIDGSLLIETGIPALRFPFKVKDARRALKRLREDGIPVADWYTTPVHPLSGSSLAAIEYTEGLCPVAEWAAAKVLTVPTRTTKSTTIARKTACALEDLWTM